MPNDKQNMPGPPRPELEREYLKLMREAARTHQGPNEEELFRKIVREFQENFQSSARAYQEMFEDERLLQAICQAKQTQLSFFQGAARALDLGATLTPNSTERPGWMEDAAALRGDWNRVGLYLAKALREFAEQNERKSS